MAQDAFSAQAKSSYTPRLARSLSDLPARSEDEFWPANAFGLVQKKSVAAESALARQEPTIGKGPFVVFIDQ
jgi:hypothetical protein